MYVAKNNNALLRYPAMRRQNRDFHAVVMFRDPLTHAESLRAMHRKYVAMQADDPFVKEYMDWLAHHEFGMGHKPFRFPSTQDLPSGDLDSLDYWLSLWINHYSEALNLDAHRLHFVSYEAYCTSPQEVLQHIVAATTQDAKVPAYAAYLKVRDVADAVDAKRLAQARSLYAEMVRRSQS